MKCSSLSILACLAVMAMTRTAAATVYVSPTGDDANPGTQALPVQTIGQALAIDPYDEVDLADGTYALTNSYVLPNVLRSTSGDPTKCVIDFQGTPNYLIGRSGTVSGIGFQNGTNSAVQQNFANGLMTVSNCSFKNFVLPINSFESGGGQSAGGGVYIINGNANIDHCTFDSCSGQTGGAVKYFGSSVGSITNCTFTNNSVQRWMRGTNSFAGDGGAVSIDDTFAISNCTFKNNSSEITGGAVSCNFFTNGPSATITDCVFDGNHSGGLSGALGGINYNVSSCRFTNNRADYIGGAIYHRGGFDTISITSCTFAGNSSAYGGTVFEDQEWGQTDATCPIQNCIFWGDSVDNPLYGGAEFAHADAVVGFNNNDVQGTLDQGVSGTGNISVDPMFVNTSAGDFHLQFGSQCIDAGLNSAVAPGATDLDGNARISGVAVDLGCYEIGDVTPPVTTDTVSGTVGNNGWYRSTATLTLTASDNMSGVARTYYTIDGGTRITYTSAFQLGNGIHTVTFWSVDKAGNVEGARSTSINVDTTVPTVTASPNYKKFKEKDDDDKRAKVVINGSISDALSGLDVSTAAFSVVDSYGKYQPSGTITVAANGTYSLKAKLPLKLKEAKGSHERTYTITISVRDMAGNVGNATVLIEVKDKDHDNDCHDGDDD